eukprot:2388796-Rhodomonas_salina.2
MLFASGSGMVRELVLVLLVLGPARAVLHRFDGTGFVLPVPLVQPQNTLMLDPLGRRCDSGGRTSFSLPFASKCHPMLNPLPGQHRRWQQPSQQGKLAGGVTLIPCSSSQRGSDPSLEGEPGLGMISKPQRPRDQSGGGLPPFLLTAVPFMGGMLISTRVGGRRARAHGQRAGEAARREEVAHAAGPAGGGDGSRAQGRAGRRQRCDSHEPPQAPPVAGAAADRLG